MEFKAIREIDHLFLEVYRKNVMWPTKIQRILINTDSVVSSSAFHTPINKRTLPRV